MGSITIKLFIIMSEALFGRAAAGRDSREPATPATVRAGRSAEAISHCDHGQRSKPWDDLPDVAH